MNERFPDGRKFISRASNIPTTQPGKGLNPNRSGADRLNGRSFMTEPEVEALEQIWEGKTRWGPEWETLLNGLAAKGYIEIVGKRRKAHAGHKAKDEILVRITDEGSGHLSGSAY